MRARTKPASQSKMLRATELGFGKPEFCIRTLRVYVLIGLGNCSFNVTAWLEETDCLFCITGGRWMVLLTLPFLFCFPSGRFIACNGRNGWASAHLSVANVCEGSRTLQNRHRKSVPERLRCSARKTRNKSGSEAQNGLNAKVKRR